MTKHISEQQQQQKQQKVVSGQNFTYSIVQLEIIGVYLVCKSDFILRVCTYILNILHVVHHMWSNNCASSQSGEHSLLVIYVI